MTADATESVVRDGQEVAWACVLAEGLSWYRTWTGTHAVDQAVVRLVGRFDNLWGKSFGPVKANT